MRCIAYCGGYKYQLKKDYFDEIAIQIPIDINSQFITLSHLGLLIIKNGYAWDGPSGPTFDTVNFMRGSLLHDALYQLMREGLIDAKIYRDKADRLLQQYCLEDGMSRIRAWWVYQSVRFFAASAAEPAMKKDIKYAPKGANALS